MPGAVQRNHKKALKAIEVAKRGAKIVPNKPGPKLYPIIGTEFACTYTPCIPSHHRSQSLFPWFEAFRDPS